MQDIYITIERRGTLDFAERIMIAFVYEFYVLLDILFILPLFLACAVLKHRFGILNEKLKQNCLGIFGRTVKEVFSKDSKANLKIMMEQFDILTDALECLNSAFTFNVILIISVTSDSNN
jgi:hypothetical protein